MVRSDPNHNDPGDKFDMASIDNVRIPIELDVTVNLNVVIDDEQPADAPDNHDGAGWQYVCRYNLDTDYRTRDFLNAARNGPILVTPTEHAGVVAVHRPRGGDA